MCFISQVCGEALPSVALLHYFFVKYIVVEVCIMIPFCLHDCDFPITLMGQYVPFACGVYSLHSRTDWGMAPV